MRFIVPAFDNILGEMSRKTSRKICVRLDRLDKQLLLCATKAISVTPAPVALFAAWCELGSFIKRLNKNRLHSKLFYLLYMPNCSKLAAL